MRAWTAAAVLAAAALAARPARAAAPPNVVLVVVDALRADHLGLYGYPRNTSPNLDALAAESVVFERAFAQADWTLPSLASLMTGRYPSGHGAVRAPAGEQWPARLGRGLLLPAGGRLGEEHETLASALRRRGWRTAAVVSGGFSRAEFGFGSGFGEYRHAAGDRREHAPAETLVRDAARWLSGRGPRPFFLYLHVYDAHDPYEDWGGLAERWDPGYEGGVDGERETLDALRSGRRSASARDRERLLALYDAGVARADRGVGALLAELRARGLLEDTLVVVTADHGEEFWEHGRQGHEDFPYTESLRVPLLLRLPGTAHAGRRMAAPARLIDVFPTVLDLLGLPAPARADGVSLRPFIEGGAARPLTAYSELSRKDGTRSAVARRDADWTYILRLDGRPGELYRADDPGEARELSSAHPGVAARLRAETRAWLRRVGAQPPPAQEPRPVPAELGRSLEALGYLDPGAGSTNR